MLLCYVALHLSRTEAELVECLRRGEALDLTGREDRNVRAPVIRALVQGKHPGAPPNLGALSPALEIDPRGLVVIGAVIPGLLDLDRVHSTVAVDLVACDLQGGMTARSANLRSLSLASCRVGPATSYGAALVFESLQVEQSLTLDGAQITGTGSAGSVMLYGARIGSSLSLCEAILRNKIGPVLIADGMAAERILMRGADAFGAGERGTVRLVGVRIGAHLSITQATLRNTSGPALVADHVQVGGTIDLEGLTATGSAQAAAVRLNGARVAQQLRGQSARLFNDGGPALDCAAVQIVEDMLLDELTATGAGSDGAVGLVAATVGGQLSCEGATLQNPSGPALCANGLQVGHDLLLDSFDASVVSKDAAAVRLAAASIGRQLLVEKGTITNAEGPALLLDAVNAGYLSLQYLKVSGAGDTALVSLFNARVSGGVTMQGATLNNATGPALYAEGLQVGGNLTLAPFDANGAGERSVVVLRGAHVGRELWIRPNGIVNQTISSNRFSLDGLTYAGFPHGLEIEEWVELLRWATSEYAAQPYRFIATAAAAAGHDADVRKILIDQRHDQLSRAARTWFERAWGRFTWWTLGYGYQPWRALVGLFLTVVIAVLLTLNWGPDSLLRAKDLPGEGGPCTAVERALVGVGFGLPLVENTLSGTCVSSTSGQWLAAIGMALKLVGWAFATLFVAGFTGAVRRT